MKATAFLRQATGGYSAPVHDRPTLTVRRHDGTERSYEGCVHVREGNLIHAFLPPEQSGASLTMLTSAGPDAVYKDVQPRFEVNDQASWNTLAVLADQLQSEVLDPTTIKPDANGRLAGPSERVRFGAWLADYLHGGPDHTEEILALFNDAEILERVVHSGSKSMERA